MSQKEYSRVWELKSSLQAQTSDVKPMEQRKWKLAQIESSLACNLKCIMCPWRNVREELNRKGHMSQVVWDSIAPHLNDIQSVDLTGGGTALLLFLFNMGICFHSWPMDAEKCSHNKSDFSDH